MKKSATVGKAGALVNEINSIMGTPALRLGNDPYFEIMRIPSGSLTIDRITGGGFALGRHVELFGDESTCKSFIAYKTMALSQDRGNVCALIDPEHSFDAKWFRHLGGNPKALITNHPRTAEEAVKAMMLLFQSGEVEVCTVDSVAAMLPREELEKDPTEEDRIAGQARFMSRALRRLTAVNEKTLVIWTNQVRTKIGISYGNPNTTSGGRALRFYDTTRIELRRAEAIKQNKKVAKKSKLVDSPVPVGHWVQCRSEKEKSTRPFLTGSFIFSAEEGEIDLGSEIIQLGLEDELIVRKGNTFSFIDLDDVEWSGTESKFKEHIRENDQLREELVEAIAEKTLEISVGNNG